MATVQTKYLGDLRTESVHLQSGSKLITDAPTDNQGRGEAFSPTDLLATAFGACVLTIMGIAAKTHGFDINGTEVETTKVMGTEPRRIVELITTFKFPHNNYSVKHKKILELTAKEFALLSLLARHKGEILSKMMIAEQVWDMNFDSDANVVEVAIKRLRAKVDAPYPVKLLHTVRGMGYVLETRPESPTK